MTSYKSFFICVKKWGLKLLACRCMFGKRVCMYPCPNVCLPSACCLQAAGAHRFSERLSLGLSSNTKTDSLERMVKAFGSLYVFSKRAICFSNYLLVIQTRSHNLQNLFYIFILLGTCTNTLVIYFVLYCDKKKLREIYYFVI